MSPSHPMNARLVVACVIWAAVVAVIPARVCAGEWVHHAMTVDLQPDRHTLKVEDTIALPSSRPNTAPLHFLLHAGLNPVSTTPGVTITRSTDPMFPAALSRLDVDGRVPVEQFTLAVPPQQRVILVSYGGELFHAVDTGEGDTPGSIAPQGVFLAASSVWYPLFDDALVTFDLLAHVPSGWQVIAQGKPTRSGEPTAEGTVRWESPEPQEEIYLVGGPLTEYAKPAGGVMGMVYLHHPDQALADRYLDATARYLAMYTKLLGSYSYAKFALVENFWETGYGMPSFTLLGPSVLRLPFILNSSYPHEILHNWWGNGVFVDPDQGNWSEGLTAYVADHLLAEQQGAGVEYRRATLQKYADYVSEGRDFPIAQFRARHGGASEAVGYGKTLMLFHMLRGQTGDDVFVRALRRFYRENRFRRADFSDLSRAFSAESGRNVEALMTPWVEKAGAPVLKVSHAKAEALGDGYLLTAQVEQTQSGAAYRLRVPVAVTLEGRSQAYQATFKLDAKQLGLELIVPGRPVRLDIDPEFDLFRRLDRGEIPPAFSLLFGAERVTILLPAGAAGPLREAYRQLAASWERSEPGRVEVVSDDSIATLPADRSVWLFGWENRFRASIADALKDQNLVITDDGVRMEKTSWQRERQTIVLVAHRPDHPDFGMGWIGAVSPDALPGLGRKLPHYGQYGYLAFEGNEPTNVAKGEWSMTGSPLSILVVQPDGTVHDVPRARLASRVPLATQ